MSKQCAKCEKTVYPIEELKCLDKIWHKSCFKCWTCGMTLNMKNYKGYDKKPYCNAHYPTTKFTAVKETPEMQRIAQNTKLQSQVQYHKDFENDKGKFTVIADDPETKRLLSNTQKTSLVKYHEEFERSVKGVKTSVTDDPELMRYKKNTAISSEIEYRGVRDKNADMETRRGNVMQGHAGNGTAGGPPYRPTGGGGGGGGAPGSIRDYNPLASEQPNQPSPYSARGQGHQVYNSTTSGSVEPRAARQPGSISDYDPMAEQSAHNYSQAKQWQESVPDPHRKRYSEPTGSRYGRPPPKGERSSMPVSGKSTSHLLRPSHTDSRGLGKKFGEPLGDHYSPSKEAGVGDYYPAPQQQQQPPPQQQHQAPPPQQQAPPPATGQRFRCVYDYTAGDSDEVSFLEEDIIVNPDPIDEGWMYGTVLRTGQRGMLPANYVEPILA